MGIPMDVFVQRMRRFDCRIPSNGELHLRSMIEGWIERRERFSMFDLPEWSDQHDARGAIQHFLKSKQIVKFGNKSICNSVFSVYGHPDAPERVGVLVPSKDSASNDFLYSEV
jgi:hypothetical protein